MKEEATMGVTEIQVSICSPAQEKLNSFKRSKSPGDGCCQEETGRRLTLSARMRRGFFLPRALPPAPVWPHLSSSVRALEEEEEEEEEETRGWTGQCRSFWVGGREGEGKNWEGGRKGVREVMREGGGGGEKPLRLLDNLASYETLCYVKTERGTTESGADCEISPSECLWLVFSVFVTWRSLVRRQLSRIKNKILSLLDGTQ